MRRKIQNGKNKKKRKSEKKPESKEENKSKENIPRKRYVSAEGIR